MMTRTTQVATLTVMIIVVCGLVGVLPASAQMANEVKIYAGENEKPTAVARIVPEEFEIGIGGTMFFRIRANAAGFTAAERARTINTRLVYIISYEPVDPSAVRIVPVRGKPTIYVGNVRLVTVYPSDVAAAGAQSMGQLASEWAAATACCLQQVAPWTPVVERM